MEFDVFGLELKCFLETATNLISPIFLLKIGQEVNLMVSCLLEEENFLKPFLQLKKIFP